TNGTLTSRFCYDPPSLTAAYKRLETEIQANTNLKRFANSDLLKGLIEETEARGGEMVTGSTSELGENEVTLHAVTDEKKYLSALEKKWNFLAPEGEVNKFYGIVGASINGSFTKAGTHKGIDLFHENVFMDAGKLKAQYRELFEFLGDSSLVNDQVAVHKGIGVVCSDKDDIKPLLDR